MSSDWFIPALVATALAGGVPAAAEAQDSGAQASPETGDAVTTPQASGPILSSDIAVSREEAELQLELRGGQQLRLTLAEDGAVRLNGDRIGAYDRRDALDQSWRGLLQRAMDAPTGALTELLVGWQPPEGAGGVAERLDRELEAALQTREPARAPGSEDAGSQQSALAPNVGASDSIHRLNERIRQLERLIEDPNADLDEDLAGLRELRRDLELQIRDEMREEIRSNARDWNNGWHRPWRNITRGLGGVFSTLMVYAIMVGLGFLAVFFGRSYLEGIADTARHSTLRSGLVGLAGSFLVLPAYILGLLALAISIVGIPLLLVFAPLFPVAVVLAVITGYLAVAHGAGEALAERRFTGTEWFTRANSYYYVMTGVGLLLVLFLAGHIISMGGAWLGFLEGLLKFMAIMLTWAAFTIGFGAVLISRGGTRPVRADGSSPDLGGSVGEESHA